MFSHSVLCTLKHVHAVCVYIVHVDKCKPPSNRRWVANLNTKSDSDEMMEKRGRRGFSTGCSCLVAQVQNRGSSHCISFTNWQKWLSNGPQISSSWNMDITLQWWTPVANVSQNKHRSRTMPATTARIAGTTHNASLTRKTMLIQTIVERQLWPVIFHPGMPDKWERLTLDVKGVQASQYIKFWSFVMARRPTTTCIATSKSYFGLGTLFWLFGFWAELDDCVHKNEFCRRRCAPQLLLLAMRYTPALEGCSLVVASPLGRSKYWHFGWPCLACGLEVGSLVDFACGCGVGSLVGFARGHVALRSLGPLVGVVGSLIINTFDG